MTESLEQRQQRLLKLQEKTSRLEKEIKAAERRRETQKLVILGRYLLQLVDRGIIDRPTYEDNLDKFLIRNVDRQLFGYPLLDEEPKKKRKKSKKPTTSKQTATTNAAPPLPANQHTTPTPPPVSPAPLTPDDDPKPATVAASAARLKETQVYAEDFNL